MSKSKLLKVLCAIFSAIIFLNVLTPVAFANYGGSLYQLPGYDFVFSLDSKTGLLIIEGTGDMLNVSEKIPMYYGTVNGMNLGPLVKNVIITENITSIGNDSFRPGYWDREGTINLQKAYVAESVKKIGERAFSIENVEVYIFSKNTLFADNAITKSATIYGYKDSTAELYAQLKGINFVTLCETHDFELINVVEATCLKDGYSGDERCKVCNGTITLGHTVEKLGHDYVLSGVVEASCQNDGYTGDLKCSRCGDILEKGYAIKKLPHTVYIDSAIEPTCTQPGKTEGSHCAKCGEVLKKQELIPLAPHTPVVIPAVESTCKQTGLNEGEKCAFCGQILKEQSIMPLKEHIPETVAAIEPTCTDTGLTEGTKCSVCGDDLVEQKVIPATGHSYEDVLMNKATLTKAGKVISTCTVCGKTGKEKTINSPKEITLSKTSYIYDGKTKKPTVTVKDSKGNVIDSSNYTVTYSSGRKNVGKYKVTVKFKNNYSGTKTLYFTIEPKGTTVSKAEAKSKGFKLTWKKQATQTTGYEIQYSTSSKFTSKTTKTVKVTSAKTVSKTLTGLKGKTKYYIRIRTYKIVDKKTYYSSWSKVKTVKTNK